MNKSDFIRKVEENLKANHMTRERANKISTQAVDLFFNEIKSAVVDGERMVIRGLGVFRYKKYKGYKGRNPKTGENIKIKDKKLPIFKVSPQFLFWLNDKLGTPIK